MNMKSHKMKKKMSNLKPFLKWAGGKSSELPIINKNLPCEFNNFYEPFVGGGAVYWSIEASNYYINDKSANLINLYKSSTNPSMKFIKLIKNSDLVWKNIDRYCKDNTFNLLKSYNEASIIDFSEVYNNVKKSFSWNHEWFVENSNKSISTKLLRMKKLEKKYSNLSNTDIISNIEGAIKSAMYFYFRKIFNSSLDKSNDEQAFLFFVMREYSYASMFRHNAKGEFNVPYGGVSYNNKLFEKKLTQINSLETQNKLSATDIYCNDFEEFLLKTNPKKSDFIFIDPPYDTEFSTYDQNVFSLDEQVRLANYLKNNCSANFMIIIKNTDFIYNLYKNFNINCFDKIYMWNIKDRNDRKTEHLMITNY